MQKVCVQYLLQLTLLVGLLSLHTVAAKAQASGNMYPAYLSGQDTIAIVQLPEVLVFKPLIFKNQRQQYRYSKLLRDVRKTLPLAKITAEQFHEIQIATDTIIDKKERKKYLKKKQEELFSRYEKRLKKLTFSQGKLLIKLIHRECQHSSYNLIKTYQGGLSAFLWQTLARTFGSNLKAEYNLDDDYLIERAVQTVEAEMLYHTFE